MRTERNPYMARHDDNLVRISGLRGRNMERASFTVFRHNVYETREAAEKELFVKGLKGVK